MNLHFFTLEEPHYAETRPNYYGQSNYTFFNYSTIFEEI